jgi:hypothetical protein
METALKHNQIEKNGTDVFSTDNYDLFKIKHGNRKINQTLVKKIYQSIVDNGWFSSSVIIVGDELVVLDGQHRIEALKMFKKKNGHAYKIKYIVDRDMDDLKKITIWQNARKGWSNEDYAVSFIAQGKSDYALYSTFRSDHQLSHTVTLNLLANGYNKPTAKLFKSGNIVIHDIDLANEFAVRIKELGTYYEYASHTQFVRAMILLWNNPLFSNKDFLKKLSRDRKKLFRVSSPEQYIRIINDIYNFGRHNKISLVK